MAKNSTQTKNSKKYVDFHARDDSKEMLGRSIHARDDRRKLRVEVRSSQFLSVISINREGRVANVSY